MDEAKQRANELLANIQNLKVNELKKELQDRGVTLPGKMLKNDLISKLKEVLEQQSVSLDDTIESSKLDEEADLLTTLEQLTQPSVPETPLVADVVPTKADISSALSATESVNPVDLAAADDGLTDGTKVKKIEPIKDAEAARKARAERFGVPVVSKSGSQVDQLKKRGERFGVVSDSLKKISDQEKLSERQKRFGADVPVTDDKLAARRARFGIVEAEPQSAKEQKSNPLVSKLDQKVKRKVVSVISAEDQEKIKKRKERFGLNA
ncbi:hypothetical protein HDE_01969 [Halotydeus destructor]|nr:hypothetical protein HDE_01969 [Halotydeus destructor]